MKIRIGILTFSKSINYGSFLQAYALFKQISSLGYDTEIIDYTQNNFDYHYSLFKFPKTKENIRYDMIHTVYIRQFLKRNRFFAKAFKNYFHVGEKCYRFGDDIQKWSEDYDVIICGSDQIWNPNARDFDENFFLPDLQNVRKISYAVSLNGGVLDKVSRAEEFKRYLMDFESISIREASSTEWLEEFLDHRKKVNVALDPTLLHNRSVYDAIADQNKIAEPFIFLYSVNFAEEVVKAALKLAEHTGLPIYTLFSGRGSAKILKSKRKIKLFHANPGPAGFLALMRDAKYVVTNSFHGTAFSVIYEKNFCSIAKTDQNNKKIRDERICNVLELLGLQDRFISLDIVKSAFFNKEIDYTSAKQKLKQLAAESMEYLKHAIE